MRLSLILSIGGIFVCTWATAQMPGVLYTWAGTGNTHDWRRGGTSFALLSNSTPGVLTVTEVGDEFDPGSTDPTFLGQDVVFADGFNRNRESSLVEGGLDLTGLDFIEIDVAHNSSGTVNAQFFIQTTPSYTYLSGNSDGTLGRAPTFGPDWAIGPGTNTLRFPVNLLTPEEQAWISSIGLSVRDHAALGYLTWTVAEVRSVGTPLSVRDLATHNVGSSDNGLNGAYVNFENAAVLGNNGGQNQTGLSHDTSGPGSLKWTDKGTQGMMGAPSGAAVTWGNGTSFANENSFYERPTDVSNYNTVTFRMSATDPLNAGGVLGVQAFFQTGNEYLYQTSTGGSVGAFGELLLPIDGQFHDLVFPLANVTNRENVQAFGVNLFSHTNNLDINVDLVRFSEEEALEGDFNQDGKVDAADYVVWRKVGGTAANYQAFVENFGRMAMTGSGGAAGGHSAVPEPSLLIVLLPAVAALISRRRAA